MQTPKSHSQILKAAGIESSQFTGFDLDPAVLVIIEDKKNILYDPRIEEPLPLALVESIRDIGIKQEVKVRKDGVVNGVPQWVVIAGKTRVRAARFINTEAGRCVVRVPCRPVSGTDEAMLDLMLLENLLRSPESVRTLGFKLQRKMDTWGGTPADLAKKFGITPQRVQAALAFQSLHPSAQAAIDKGDVGVGTILALAEVPRAEQPKLLAELKAQGRTKNHEVAAVVAATTSGRPPPAKAVHKKVLTRSRMVKMVSAIRDKHPTKSGELVAAVLEAVMGDPAKLAELEPKLEKLFSAKRVLGPAPEAPLAESSAKKAEEKPVALKPRTRPAFTPRG